MRLIRAALACVFMMSSTAFAQPEGEEEGKGPEATEETEKKDEKKAEADTAPVQTEKFFIRRGFFAESDLGIFLTFGGRNTNNFEVPSRFSSNIQPYVGLRLGYDIVHGDAYSFALGLKLAMGLSGGAGRVTSTEREDPQSYPTTMSNDFNVIEAGLGSSLAIMLSERVALTIKVDGGLAILDPDPRTPALTGTTPGTPLDGSGKAAFAFAVGGGLGVEYFTLLNDFSVGAVARFVAVIHDGMIPGLSVTIPVKYTF